MVIRKIALGMAALLLCALLSGCQARLPAAEPALVLGFSQLGSESSFRIGNTRDIEEKAKEYGVERHIGPDVIGDIAEFVKR